MKIEHLKRAAQLQTILYSIDNAISQTNQFLEEKTVSIFGYQTSGETGLYQLYISEYRDRSGLSIDLTNSGIGIDLVKSILPLLQKQKETIEAEIKTL